MYDSYDYDSENKTVNPQPTIEELKAREKALKAERKAQKKAEKKAKKANRKKSRLLPTIGLACVFGIVASTVFQLSNYAVDKVTYKPNEEANARVSVEEKDPEKEVIEEKPIEPVEVAPKESPDVKKTEVVYQAGAVTEVANAAMPSIVAITNKSVQEVLNWYGMGIEQYEAESAGSGIIIGKNDTELLIVTNAHVVEGAQTLSVCFIDENVCQAVTKGSDSSNDIAVISVSLSDIGGSTLDAIKVATMGDSKELQIGEQVVAIGNALGYGQSVTTGIISALDRDITDDNVDNHYIQTDAAINPGNSGGALLNMKGELVGINSAKLANTKIEGMGYAIPTSAAKPIMDDLVSRATRTLVDEKDAGYIGISGFSVTKDVSIQYGIPEGIYVSEVTQGAAADRAGLQKGDIITAFDGINMNSINKLREQLGYYRAGETVDITIYRTDDGEYSEKTFKITLDGRKGTPLDSDYGETEEDTNEEDDQSNEYENDFKDYLNPRSRNIFDFFGY